MVNGSIKGFRFIVSVENFWREVKLGLEYTQAGEKWSTRSQQIWDELYAHLHSSPALLGAQAVLDQSDQSSRAEHARWAEREQWERMLASLHETQSANQTQHLPQPTLLSPTRSFAWCKCVTCTVLMCLHGKDSRGGFSIAGRSDRWATWERNEHTLHILHKTNEQMKKYKVGIRLWPLKLGLYFL